MNARPNAAIGYVLNRFSQLSERFLFDEILQLESCGISVHLFVLDQAGRHSRIPGLERLRATVRYAPEGPACDGPDALAASIRPVPCELRASKPEASADGTMPMQAQWIASHIVAQQIAHLHVHLAKRQTEVIEEAQRLTGFTYSFTDAGGNDYDDTVAHGSLSNKIRDAQFVITTSDFNRRRLMAASTSARKIHRIYPGVDLSRLRFHGQDGRDPNSVLAVAPLVRGSGLANVLRAIRILRDRRPAGVRLTIVGEGELETELRARISSFRLNDCVTLLTGDVQARLLSLMRVHAAMTLPYRIAPGGVLPCVLVEAMAVGLPVIATAGGSISEVITDGWTGRLISPDDPSWLAGAMETLLDNPSFRLRMAEAARETVERQFDVSRNIAPLVRLFAGSTYRSTPESVTGAKSGATVGGEHGP